MSHPTCAARGCDDPATHAVHFPESWFPMCAAHAGGFLIETQSEVRDVRPLQKRDV